MGDLQHFFPTLLSTRNKNCILATIVYQPILFTGIHINLRLYRTMRNKIVEAKNLTKIHNNSFKAMDKICLSVEEGGVSVFICQAFAFPWVQAQRAPPNSWFRRVSH